MLRAIPVLFFSLLAAAGASQAAAVTPSEQPALHALANAPSKAELRATITALVGFGTRHTLSDTKSDSRGIGAARRWVKSRFEAISRDCGGCIDVVTPSQVFSGKRIPQPTEVMDVVAIKRGKRDPDRVIVMTGHLDSRVTDVMNATSDAPGANDDASGVAALIEAARLLSKQDNDATLVFAALSGEEQGLYGGKVLADYAVAHGWQVEAQLNNDIVGNSQGQNGVIDNTTVRVFSEGTKSNETAAQADYRRYHGGEVDSPSRNLARYIERLADNYLPDFQVRMVYRTDRYGRGGDQVPFLEAGYPAVRVTEAHENYTRQHQDLRSGRTDQDRGVHYGDTIDGIDFRYLARVTALNAIAMAALSRAPAPPTGVDSKGALATDTTLSWHKVPGAAGYRVHWRDTTAAQWQHARAVGDVDQAVLQDVVIDDWFFGVSSVSADGYESPVVFPGYAGSFERSPAAASGSAGR
ncbi:MULTISPECIES: M20/M25/M40 family metallo-hydrolase [unclassified Rhodanobacter]|uniref:M20/M25/M40 family metallo-hydrolase n=1 Tax=unclassified Rhodanobacter TaxID=2621553 RepID=UPI001BDED24D|nr:MULTISPECIES: M20/M25/M40 family metallo-hydrolase [unclassified Rhodanobacter]MBT2144317.1 M20/M25/M40 family metallo-hydrolase [Rhodanobacter sp. LX-99]MBT2150016.1 M20/M25/M40 family metallo-hydrolase [Rhodanobacter sp. LX-100]